MLNDQTRHEIVVINPDVEVRFYLSEDEGSFVTPHWHNSLEMVYVIEGSIEVTCENYRRLVKPGEFILINSRNIHSVLSIKNKALVLQIPKEMLERFIPEIEMYYFEVDMNPVKETEKTRLKRVKEIFMDMYVVYDIRPEGYLLKFNSLLYDLLYYLRHSYSERLGKRQIDKKNKYLAHITEVMEHIKRHYKEPLHIPDIAKKFGYHPDYLARIFRRYMGMTIVDYLYAVRIQHVYRELMDTDKFINQILDENGCQNYRVAMRVFKEKYGCTPKEKRIQIKKTNSE